MTHRVVDAAGRVDLAVHALAQSSDDVTLGIAGTVDERVRLLVSAYGLDDRVMFDDDDGAVWEPTGTLGELVESLADRSAALRPEGDAIFRGQRVAIVTNLATHYRVPVFNRIAQRIADAGGQLKVFVLSAEDKARPWMKPEAQLFESEVLPTFRVPGTGRQGRIPVGVGKALRRYAPTTVVVGGYAPFVAMPVARYCSATRTPFGVWSGEIRSRSTAKSRLRGALRTWIIKRASFGIAYGAESAEYLRELAPTLPVCIARNTTPVIPGAPRPASGRVVEALTVARAVKGKALDSLVDAFDRLRDLPVRLTFVGDGPELPALKQRAAGNPNIVFLGAIRSDEVLERFGASDIFLFPSRFDVFGLVLVEAMGAGLATVLTRAPGAAADLTVDGVNALLVDEAPESWAAAIRRLVEDEGLRLRLGTGAARTIAQRWTLDHSADAFIAGLRLGRLSVTGAGDLVTSAHLVGEPVA